jgi:hypothetical protein
MECHLRRRKMSSRATPEESWSNASHRGRPCRLRRQREPYFFSIVPRRPSSCRHENDNMLRCRADSLRASDRSGINLSMQHQHKTKEEE